MSTDRYVAERLPWYLNGTLDENERAEVERQLAESEHHRADLAEAREVARIYGHRLPTQVLVDYVFDGASDEVPGDLIERHLAASPLARAEYEMLVESRAALSEESADDKLPEGVVPFARPAAGGWRRLALAASLVGATAAGLAVWQWSQIRSSEGQLAEVRRQLEDALAAEPSTPVESSAPAEVGPVADSATDPDAAMERRVSELEIENEQLAAGKSDLVDQIENREQEIERLGEQIAEFSRPQANLPVVDLYPGDMVLRGEQQSERVIGIDRADRSVALILNSGIGADQQVTGMRLRDRDDAVIWASSARPLRDDLGTFTVSLPVGQLAPGSYTVELIDGAGSDANVIESYQIDIR